MSLLSASEISQYFGDEEIFGGLSVAIPAGARIAMVGANGAGKTSLIRILAGYDQPKTGAVNTARGARIAFLPQRPELAGEHSLWQEQLKAFADLRRMEARLEELEGRMTAGDSAAALEAYGALQAEFERLGGYTYEARIKMALGGLGFTAEEYARPLPQLSGGGKTRAALSRLLLESPDLLILDEPTNHLDIYAVEWLERFLATFDGAVLAVSHDRYFIDRFARVVWELEAGRLRAYRGNYSSYSQQRLRQRQTLRVDYARQQRFIAKEREFIRRHMGSRGTAQAKGRKKKLATLEKRGAIIESGPRTRKKMFLDMGQPQRSGDQVIVTRGLRIGYPGAPLLDVPDLLVTRGETVGVIGGNGVGKSTLLKTVGGVLPALAGEARLGAKVKPGYFAQAHETLAAERSLLDEIQAVKPMPLSAARDWLGRFLFSGDDVFRPIASLSGGERGRVALAKLALQGASLLLLDEPTNHLDLDSQEVLQAALESFGGTILLVSHDRYLIEALATQIWEIAPGGMTVFAGDYQAWLRNRKSRQAREAAERADQSAERRRQPAVYAEKVNGLSPFQRARRATELEEEIGALEAQISAISQAIGEASQAGQSAKTGRLGESYARAEAELAAAMEEWERLAE